MIAVNVKWGKQKFENVEVDTSESPLLFKTQLFALTGVPVERQKVMGLKGGQLKDDTDWATVGLKPGQTVMLMGTADKLPDPPPEPTKFVEDMPEVVDVAAMENPAGLRNLGNTCYLNSSMQVIKAIPEVSHALQRYVPAQANEPGASLVLATRELLAELDRSTAAREVLPLRFVSTFRQLFPRFAEQAENGAYAQQDAEECWSQIVANLSSRLRLATGGEPSNLETAAMSTDGLLQDNLGDVLFGIQMTSELSCEDAPDEPKQTSTEALRRLSCHLKPGTAHLYNAIEGSLEESIEKHSPTLGREASYKKVSRIARLPPYLSVQFVRFAWRADSQKRCKVLKEISFPDMLDLRNLLDPSLKKRVNGRWKELEVEAVGSAPAAAPAGGSAEAMEVERAPAAAGGASSSEPQLPALPLPPAVTARDNLTGRYELFAIVTHEGRTAEGGHYVAWVKQDDGGWLVFDDETVARVSADKIKKLYGGGDYHMAYMCFYRHSTKLEDDIRESARRSAGLPTLGGKPSGAADKA